MKNFKKTIIITFLVFMLLSMNIGFGENEKDIPVIRSIQSTNTHCINQVNK